MDTLGIITQIKNGQTFLYKEVVLFYQKPVIRYLIGFGIRKEVVEEIAQDVFTQAFFKLDTFDSGKAQFSTWLFTIAKNRALNELKSSHHKLEELKDVDVMHEQKTPLEKIETQELGMKIQSLVQKLPLPFRNVITLFFVNEMSINDIAHVEHCSVGTVKSRIFRGRELLKTKLEREIL